MINSNTFFTVKNASVFLLLTSTFFSFTNLKENNKGNLSQSKSTSSFGKPFFKGKENSASAIEGSILPFSPIPFDKEAIIESFIHPDNLDTPYLPVSYTSIDSHEGIIGSIDQENWNDNPSDNIFNVNLLNINKSKKYTLVYSAKGVANTSSVTRSINKSMALGGYIISKSNEWMTISEEIDPTLLKTGNNQILFNSVNTKDFYFIKDVRIIEAPQKPNFGYAITSLQLGNDKIYLKGFFKSDSKIRSIEIAGKNAVIVRNEFEYFDTFPVLSNSNLNITFLKTDGLSFTEKISIKDVTKGKSETNTFIQPKERLISQNSFGKILGLRSIDFPPLEASITNVNKDYSGYRFESYSQGKKTINLPYDKNSIPKGFSENDISSFFFDYSLKKWQRLKIDSIDTEKEHVIITVDEKTAGDTDYINGIIKNPESPETTSFTATTTNDIPVANPTSKINMIEPPVANQQGSANVSYPIEIPAGINGFQPAISINYNSDAKTGGWAGLGWDVPIETIDIDTRWGVPEFSTDKESEIYTINGEQLVSDDSYLPNKTPKNLWKDRSNGDLRFYTRTGIKQGTKIIRKESSSKDYTWEITDDDGTVKKYNVLLKDNSGNIVRWYLGSISNKYSHNITYNYTTVSDNNGGKNIYLSKITYSNNTTIEFKNQSSQRPDLTSSYRLGTKISESKLLQKIEVKRGGTLVREYDFVYETGDFGKQLLKNIIQKKGSEEFNRHNFKYTKISENDPYNPEVENLDFFSKNSKNITSPSDNLTSGNFNEAKMSLISGVQGKNKNFKGALTFGFGFGVSGNKKRTGGLNYTYSENENFGKSQLMDMDGDGLPDKVFYKDGGPIRYRRNIGTGFSPTLSTVNGLYNVPLSKNSSYTNSFGVEASFKIIQGGLTYSKTKANSSVYFTDINGDGLPDLIDRGKAYFNKLRLSGNTPVNSFAAVEDNSQALMETPNTILKGIDAPIITTPEEETNLLANIVRVWEAPTAGNVSITNVIKLEQNSSDGVDVWMEKGALTRVNENNSIIPQSTKISSTLTLHNQGQQQNLNVNSVSVEKGQRIYIIASSKEKTKGDIVKVDSKITYTGNVPGVSDLTIKDANGYDYFKFNYSDTFLISDNKPNAIGDKAKVNISWASLDNITFTDDVDFKIYKFEKRILDSTEVDNSERQLIYHHKLNKGASLNEVTASTNLLGTSIQNLLVNQTSTETDPKFTYLYFDVSADTNVAWNKINWKPNIEIQSESDTTQIKAIVKYNVFNEKVRQNYPKNFSHYKGTSSPRFYLYPKFTESLSIPLNLYLPESHNTTVTFSLKIIYNNKIYFGKKTVQVSNNIMPIPGLSFDDIVGHLSGDENDIYDLPFYFEITCPDYDVAKKLADINPYITSSYFEGQNDDYYKQIKPDYYSTRSETKHYNSTTGNMWQGWGGFAYNASKYPGQTLKEQEFSPNAVQEEDFELPDCGDPTSSTYESCMLNYINQQQNSRYFTSLAVDPDSESYTSPMESAFLNKEQMQPYNMLAHKPSETFEGDTQIITANPTGIVIRSYGNSINIYGGVGPFQASGGKSDDETSDHFIDLNGDQFPDIINGNKYYKTDITGGLTNFTLIADKTMRNKTKNTNIGGSITKSINPEKNSNTQTTGATSWGELYSHMGSSFSASGASLNAGLGNSESRNSNIWLDINGDGLVDYISEGQVFINNGKDFIYESGWNIGNDVFKNTTQAVSGGGGVNFGNGSWVAGVGKNFSYSKNNVFFIDMNGDGLVDKLVRNEDSYDLYINLGSRLSNDVISLGEVNFTIENNQNSSGFNLYGTVCVAFGLKVCVSLGAGNDNSTNKQTVDLRDFNGDGLPDILLSTNDTQMTVIENQAGKFNLLSSITNPLGGNMYLIYGDTNPKSQTKIGNTYQMPTTKQALIKLQVDDTESRYNITDYGKWFPPLMKSYFFEYENGVQDRRERMFLGFGKVKTITASSYLPDGVAQVMEYETNFTNSNDFYAPYDASSVRKYFYKKGLIKSTYVLDSIGRERQRVDYIYRYFDHEQENYVLSENQTEPVFKDMGRIIPFLYKTETLTTEFSGANSHTKKITAIINEYDTYGNVIKYSDLGSDVNATVDDTNVTIAYHPFNTTLNIGGIPERHTVTNSANVILRKSETEIDNKGQITKIKRFLGSNFAEYKYEYDSNGNLKKSILPLNTGESESDRMFYAYDYDTPYNTYITKVSDARGLSSSTTYDYLLGVPKTVKDANGQISEYRYDNFGRLVEYRSPTDTDWTIKLKYFKAGTFNSKAAVTEKKAPIVNGVTPTLNYFSSVYVSNWGEELASKKLFSGSSNNYVYTYTKSPVKDTKGRAVTGYANKLATQEAGSIMDVMQQFYPSFSDMLNIPEFLGNSISYKYDELDRPVKAIQHGVVTNAGVSDLITETHYGFDSDRNGVIQFSKKTVSPNGLVSISYADEKGRTTAVKQVGDGKNLWVSYAYDLLNQLIAVKDQNSNRIEYTYDQLGRRVSEDHPDAGLTNYEYDNNSNLISSDNPVLRSLNKNIAYQYKFNRLTKIIYPDYTVTYEYGNANAADFGAGRLIKQIDHTGIQLFKYNELGQVVENRRFMVAPNVDPKLFKTSYVYDSYNRINKIVYPDNEEVFYNYTPFGLLDNIQSKAPGSLIIHPIISKIKYNYNEQTTETIAGNGTKTQYLYDPWSRLKELTLEGISEQVRKNQYVFDKDNNISSLITSVPMTGGALVKNDISAASVRNFEYDGFNRLKRSKIETFGKTEKKYYELEMAYTDMHGIANKDSRWKSYSPTGCQNPAPMGYKAIYSYGNADHPNAPSSIEFNTPNTGGTFTTPWDCGSEINSFLAPSSERYTYDANGNMTKVEESAGDPLGGMSPEPSIKRQLFWDAQNRLKGIVEGKAFHHYVYDETGQRAIKSEGASRDLRVDGNVRPTPNPTIMGAYQYYPNGYVVMNDRQISKHYYIGSNKVAARVSETPTHAFIVPSSQELSSLSGALMAEAEAIVDESGNNPIQWQNTPPLDTGGISLETEEDCSNYIMALVETFLRNDNRSCYSKLMHEYDEALNNGKVCEFWYNFQLDDCMIDHPTETQPYQTYWVHPDHLGSGSVITNQDGLTTNWYEYMPFGEMLMEQSSGDYDNIYKYNGKELDESTGLYYYGARYYDPRTSIWLSVDPLAVYNPVMESEFYGDGQHNGGVFYSGNLNPYIYTYQNPIRFIDPNGKQTESSATRKGFVPNIPQPQYIPLNPPSTVPTSPPVAEPSSSPRFWGALGALGTRLLAGGFLLLPGTLNAPQPKFYPNLPNAPSDGDSSDGITLYRGVSSDYRTATKREMYNNAKFGVAVPLGEEGGHDDPDLHAKGNNNSIFTSWTTDKKVADKFARGSGGKYPGVILSKKFKFGEAFPNTSQTAQKANEGEWLVPGIVTGANVEKVKK